MGKEVGYREAGPKTAAMPELWSRAVSDQVEHALETGICVCSLDLEQRGKIDPVLHGDSRQIMKTTWRIVCRESGAQ